MTRYKVAIIGTGAIAGAHMEALKAMGGRVRVVAAVDADGARVEAFRAAHGITHAYTEVEAMLAAHQPDLVHIATPPRIHADLTIRCLEAGAWVLCEKPLCGSLAELDRIEAAERATGKYCSSVAQWRFGSGARRLKDLIRRQELGRLLVGICQTTWYRGLAYYQVPWRGTWESELGGTTMGHGIHAMDLFLWLFGDWQVVSAMVGTLDRPIEVDDVSMALVRFGNGAFGSIVNSALSPRQETYLRFDFQRATVELRTLYGYENANWRYSAPEGAAEDAALTEWRRIPTDVPASHTAQLAALLDSMDRDEPPAMCTPEARRTIEFVTSLYKAGATGALVGSGSIGQDDPFYHHVGGHVPPGSHAPSLGG
ncbi:MAG TPA: Gfo/Idh/MocA family oxidoreductase [Chloroflexota bacterium]|nr:Gfo/Idh/MocA family oxidoreductase [Chloroflexota bacterium]